MSSASIYNHRNLQPSGPPSQPGPPPQHNQTRLNEAFEIIRQEHDLLISEMNIVRSQRDELENKVAAQVSELNLIRQALYDLEGAHNKIRQQYDEEIARLRADAAQQAQVAAVQQQQQQHLHPSQQPQSQASLPPPPPPPPPPSSSSSQPGSGTQVPPHHTHTSQVPTGGGGPPPPTGPPAVGRSVPGAGSLVSIAGPPPSGVSSVPPVSSVQQVPGQVPAVVGPGAGAGSYGAESYYAASTARGDRDRVDRVDRNDRDGRDGRDRAGMADQRESKRHKSERIKTDRATVPGPLSAGIPVPGSVSVSSVPGGAGGPSVLPPYVPEREKERERERERERVERERERERERDREMALAAARDRGGDRDRGDRERDRDRDLDRGRERDRDRDRERERERVERERERERERDGMMVGITGPGVHGPPPPGSGVVAATSQGAFPDELDIHTVPPEYKREGTDWCAVFNPKVKRVLDVQLVHNLVHESVVCCVRFSSDGKYLATGCNRTAQIYDTKTGAKTCVLTDETAGKAGDLYIRSVCFSPDGKLLATGAEDKQIRIWEISKKRILRVFDGHQQEIYSLDFSLDGRLIVSGSGDKTARIWDMANADAPPKVLTINDPDSLNGDAGVTSVAISPNGQFVAAGSLDTVVRIWDVATGHLVERLRGHRDSVYSVAFTPDGKGLVSGSLDKTLKFWDVSGLLLGGNANAVGGGASGSSSSSSSSASSNSNGAGASANGTKKVTGPGTPGQQGVVVKRDGGEKIASPCTMNFTGHKDYVLSVAVSHDGQWVVSGSKDRGVQFWDARSAVVQCMLQGHKNSVISIDLSPTGGLLATGSGDWQARIWSYGPL